MMTPSSPSAPHLPPRAPRQWLLLLPLLMITACQEETRVVSVRGLLHGLPGAEGGTQTTTQDEADEARRQASDQARREGQWDRLLQQFPHDKPADPEEATPLAGSAESAQPDAAALAESYGLRKTDRQGNITLISRSPGDVMYHIMSTLKNEEHELFLDQVLSEKTKQEYIRRGRDPMEAVIWLSRRQEQIADLFSMFPMGDQTPGVLLENIGRNSFRLSAPVSQREELRLHTFDVIIERGQFRLLLIK